MSFAFEITSEDVLTVANDRLKLGVDEAQADKLLDDIDTKMVEDGALYGDDMDEQTEYAYEEIARQLKENGHAVG